MENVTFKPVHGGRGGEKDAMSIPAGKRKLKEESRKCSIGSKAVTANGMEGCVKGHESWGMEVKRKLGAK